MKYSAIVFALLSVIAGGASASENAGSVGPGQGIVLPSTDGNPCPPATLCINFDGSTENAYCWQYGGIVPPFYGAFAECCDHNGLTWFGYWANWANQACGYFVAADTDGPGGCPYTNIAPGIGYPTGWNNVSAVWGPTRAIGIGAWFNADGMCGIELLLTSVGYPCGPLDVYVWADAGGMPGTVLGMTSGLDPCPVATWPSVSTHDFRLGGPVPIEQSTWGAIKRLYE